MQNLKDYMANFDKENIKNNFSFYLFAAFFAVAVFNPFFQKYDYGAGFPIVALFSGLLVAFFISEFREKREGAFWEKLFLGIFGISVIISFYFSQTKNLGFPDLIASLSVIPFYLFFAHKKLAFRDKLIKFFGIVGFLAVCQGYVMYFLLEPTRMTGPFFNVLYHSNFWPNAFATFLVMIWPLYLWIYKGKFNFFAILVLSFVLGGLLLSFSRGAVIAFAGQILLFSIYYFRRIKIKTVLIAILISILSISFFYFANFARSLSYHTIDVGERIAFQNNEIQTSGQERTDFWFGAIELIKEKPFFGYGPFSFRYAFNPIQKIFLGSSDHPHNVFLKIGAENGLIALVSFLAFLITILVLIFSRFKKLPNDSKDFVAICVIAVVGVFAHSLIDYNFNFFHSFLLLFSLLLLIRSEIVINGEKFKKAFLASLFSVIIFTLCVFEFSVIFISSLGISDEVEKYSLYPRYKYLTLADKLLAEKKFDESLKFLDKQVQLNPLDAQAYYLKGAIYCNKDFSGKNNETCRESFKKALDLNPQNDVFYYREYLRILETLNSNELIEFRKICLDLFNDYFGYTKYNVHFTAYTPQVEGAVEMAEILLKSLEKDEAKKIREKIVLMLQYAKEHRGGKTF